MYLQKSITSNLTLPLFEGYFTNSESPMSFQIFLVLNFQKLNHVIKFFVKQMTVNMYNNKTAQMQNDELIV